MRRADSVLGTCSLREAHIISGVLARVSIPVLHSAAAIKTLCDIAAEQASQSAECVSASNLLLKTLLEKRYALRMSKHGPGESVINTDLC